jgi:hypothetical protein
MGILEYNGIYGQLGEVNGAWTWVDGPYGLVSFEAITHLHQICMGKRESISRAMGGLELIAFPIQTRIIP